MFPYFQGKPIKKEGHDTNIIHAPLKRSLRVGAGFPTTPVPPKKGQTRMSDQIEKAGAITKNSDSPICTSLNT